MSGDVLGAMVAAVAVGIGLWQYRTTSRNEFLKPVREAQLRLYEQASSAAAKVATLPKDSAGWSDARDEFLRLYWGPLAIVEDYRHNASTDSGKVTVEEAM